MTMAKAGKVKAVKAFKAWAHALPSGVIPFVGMPPYWTRERMQDAARGDERVIRVEIRPVERRVSK